MFSTWEGKIWTYPVANGWIKAGGRYGRSGFYTLCDRGGSSLGAAEGRGESTPATSWTKFPKNVNLTLKNYCPDMYLYFSPPAIFIDPFLCYMACHGFHMTVEGQYHFILWHNHEWSDGLVYEETVILCARQLFGQSLKQCPSPCTASCICGAISRQSTGFKGSGNLILLTAETPARLLNLLTARSFHSTVVSGPVTV